MLAAILDPDLVPGEPNLLVGVITIKAALMFLIMMKVAMMFLSMIKAAIESWVTLSPNHPWLPLLLDQTGEAVDRAHNVGVGGCVARCKSSM